MMAEYVALSSVMRELLPLKRLVRTIAHIVTGDENVKIVTKSNVFEDNNGALTVTTLPKITQQSKFFTVKLDFFREHVKTESSPDGEIHIQKIETLSQLADIMTKGLVEATFVLLQDMLMEWDLDKETEAQESNLHSRGRGKCKPSFIGWSKCTVCSHSDTERTSTACHCLWDAPMLMLFVAITYCELATVCGH